MEQRLIAVGILPDYARAAAELFDDEGEARAHLEPPGSSGRPAWKEWYSLKWHRYYYYNNDKGETQWFMPPTLQLSEWLLDFSVTGLDLHTCRQLHDAMLLAVQGSSHLGEELWGHLAILAKLLANIVGCGNTVPKYRTVSKANPKIRALLQAVGGVDGILVAVGFADRPAEEAFVFPEAGPLPRLALVSSKLAQLLGRRGFTGLAVEHDDTGATTASKYAGKPGFRYQTEIHECSCCSRPINDGSERLFTRQHDAPHGEYRYRCETCQSYNLCEACWDRYVAGELQHPEQHSFSHHPPKASQHYMYSQQSDGNPWGRFAGGGISSRSRERLKERTGL